MSQKNFWSVLLTTAQRKESNWDKLDLYFKLLLVYIRTNKGNNFVIDKSLYFKRIGRRDIGR